MRMTTEEIDAFLTEPFVGVLSTVDGEGAPRGVPLWFHWEDGAAYIFSNPNTAKWRNLQQDPRASLCVDRRDVPYAYVLLEGIVEESNRPIDALVLEMSIRYYGDEQGRKAAEMYLSDSDYVIIKLTPQRIVSWVQDDYPA